MSKSKSSTTHKCVLPNTRQMAIRTRVGRWGGSLGLPFLRSQAKVGSATHDPPPRTDKQTNTQTHKQTDKQTSKQTHKQTNKQPSKQASKQTRRQARSRQASKTTKRASKQASKASKAKQAKQAKQASKQGKPGNLRKHSKPPGWLRAWGTVGPKSAPIGARAFFSEAPPSGGGPGTKKIFCSGRSARKSADFQHVRPRGSCSQLRRPLTLKCLGKNKARRRRRRSIASPQAGCELGGPSARKFDHKIIVLQNVWKCQIIFPEKNSTPTHPNSAAGFGPEI